MQPAGAYYGDRLCMILTRQESLTPPRHKSELGYPQQKSVPYIPTSYEWGLNPGLCGGKTDIFKPRLFN